MYIHEAIRARTPERPYIMRRCWVRLSPVPGVGVKLQPTNSPDGCIIESDMNEKSRRSWKPTAEDLTADDRVTVGL